MDLSQVVVTGVIVALSGSFSTLTSVLITRYFPRVLDRVEKAVGDGLCKASRRTVNGKGSGDAVSDAEMGLEAREGNHTGKGSIAVLKGQKQGDGGIRER